MGLGFFCSYTFLWTSWACQSCSVPSLPAGGAPGGSAAAQHCQGWMPTRAELCYPGCASGLEVLGWLLRGVHLPPHKREKTQIMKGMGECLQLQRWA